MATILTKPQRQPMHLFRLLMNELFSENEMRCSAVSGNEGSLPVLDEDTTNAILCMYIYVVCIIIQLHIR